MRVILLPENLVMSGCMMDQIHEKRSRFIYSIVVGCHNSGLAVRKRSGVVVINSQDPEGHGDFHRVGHLELHALHLGLGMRMIRLDSTLEPAPPHSHEAGSEVSANAPSALSVAEFGQ